MTVRIKERASPVATNPQTIEAFARETGEPKGSVARSSASMVREGLIRVGGPGGGRGAVHLNSRELACYLLGTAAIGAAESTGPLVRTIGALWSKSRSDRWDGSTELAKTQMQAFDAARMTTLVRDIRQWTEHENAVLGPEAVTAGRSTVLPGPDLLTGLAALIELRSEGHPLTQRMREARFRMVIRQCRTRDPEVAVLFEDYVTLGTLYSGAGPDLVDELLAEGRGDEIGEGPEIFRETKLNMSHVDIAARLWTDTKSRRSVALPLSSVPSKGVTTKNTAPLPGGTVPSEVTETTVKPKLNAQFRDVEHLGSYARAPRMTTRESVTSEGFPTNPRSQLHHAELSLAGD